MFFNCFLSGMSGTRGSTAWTRSRLGEKRYLNPSNGCQTNTPRLTLWSFRWLLYRMIEYEPSAMVPHPPLLLDAGIAGADDRFDLGSRTDGALRAGSLVID